MSAHVTGGMACLRCGATTTNGLALCELCRRKVVTDLEFLPTYFANLSRWRPGRAAGKSVYGSRALWDGVPQGTGDRVRDALDEASNTLTTWARTLSESTPVVRRPLEIFNALMMGEVDPAELDEVQTARLLSRAFEKNLTSIATKDWAGEFAIDMSWQEESLRALTESVVPGWYAGACGLCGYATHVVPGLTWVTCTNCGATTYVRDRLPIILTEARPWVARPRKIAEALVALLDYETDSRKLYNRIRQWAVREQLEPVDRWGYDPRLGYARDYEPPTGYHYRLGDVLDCIEAGRAAEKARGAAS